MAAIGESDPRWLVAPRPDGANVNAWHWTAKDVTQITKAALSVGLEAPPLLGSASPVLQHCKLSSVGVAGECSINTRKGRRFLLFELQLTCKWEGRRCGADGSVLERASGSLSMPDISPECLDDLAVDFESDARGEPLSEAMRKDGIPAIRRAVQGCLRTLELKVAEAEGRSLEGASTADASKLALVPASGAAAVATAGQEAKAGATAEVGDASPRSVETSPRGSMPSPDALPAGAASSTALVSAAPPAKLENADAGAAAVLAAVAAARPPPVEEAAEAAPLPTSLPFVVRLMLDKVRTSPMGHVTAIRLAACSVQDQHLQPIIELLHRSSNSIEVVDLSYNELTDAGAALLLDALAMGSAEGTGAANVTSLHLGGNAAVTQASRDKADALSKKRPEITVDWRPVLVEAKPCCTVGMVYKNSPAAKAGLLKGDVVLQWVMFQKGRTLMQRFGFQPSMQDGFGEAFFASCEYLDVAKSISPLVRVSIGMPHDLIVRRKAEAGEESIDGFVCLKLRLTPERWSGQGLLGCILK